MLTLMPFQLTFRVDALHAHGACMLVPVLDVSSQELSAIALLLALQIKAFCSMLQGH
jgi:hypothetical protein